MSEGSLYVVIARVDLFVGVGNSEIPDPDALTFKALWVFKFRLCVFTCPVVDGKAPWEWVMGAVENWASFFVSVQDIDHAEWGEMGMWDEDNDSFVCAQAEAFLEVFY